MNQETWDIYYMELADKLLTYKDNKEELYNIFIRIQNKSKFFEFLHLEKDWWKDRNYLLDPLTIFATFNRGLKTENRLEVMHILKEEFSLIAEPLERFEGIPVVDKRNSFFNEPELIWKIYEEGIKSADSDIISDKFNEDFNNAVCAKNNGLATITMGLFWIRPNYYVNLDGTNYDYIIHNLTQYSSILDDLMKDKKSIDGINYIKICNELKRIINENDLEYTNFIDMSDKAYLTRIDPWFPKDFEPNISKETWLDILTNHDKVTTNQIIAIKRIKDFGCEATCTQLAKKYGESKNFYNKNFIDLAMIANKHCGIELSEEKNAKYWPTLFLGKKCKSEGDGSFIYKLRKELSEAIDEINLDINTKVNPENESCNYWWMVTNPKVWTFDEIDINDEQTYTLYNANGNKRRIFKNFQECKENDIIIGYESNPTKKIVALGKITKANDGKNIYFTKTESLINHIELESIKENEALQEMEWLKNTNGSLFKLTSEEYNELMDMIREKNHKKEYNYENYTKSSFINEVFMTESKYDKLINLLKYKKNIILQGAPGVGKTFAAKRLAYSLMNIKDDNRIQLVQFHQNYTYEDFILGYKPTESGFELKEGIFYNFCVKASNDKDNDYFFIIDEINRGNMSKIFGELLMLIEKDYRDTSLVLAYNQKIFKVPSNIYIIGMMNTADRSLAMIDYALRRRFSFVEFEPGFETNGFKTLLKTLNNEKLNKTIDMIKSLNIDITEDSSLGKGFCIGHSYFCLDNINDDILESIITYDILPMLEEYWYDEIDKYNLWKDRLLGILSA